MQSIPSKKTVTGSHAFGMVMDGRSWTAGSGSAYRFGMNTQEKDNEIFEGAYTAEYWEYDSRLGRRWNLDPKPSSSISSYACFGNNPIWFNDPLGDTIVVDLFDKTSDLAIFHDVANSAVSKQTNDGIFMVYAHSNSEGIQYTDKKGNIKIAVTAEEFNAVMSARSPAYAQSLKDGKQIVLKLYACNAASEEYVAADGSVVKIENTIAEKISVELPANSTVVAADGYVWFGKINRKPAIIGVEQTSEAQPQNTNNGGFVTIKNGKTVAKQKMSYNSKTRTTKKGEKKKIKGK